jgi:hypothetical protein
MWPACGHLATFASWAIRVHCGIEFKFSKNSYCPTTITMLFFCLFFMRARFSTQHFVALQKWTGQLSAARQLPSIRSSRFISTEFVNIILRGLSYGYNGN